MMTELVKSSLERISSLQEFYKSEQESIMAKANEGMRRNRFGYQVDAYFFFLAAGTEEECQSTTFQNLKKYAEQYLEVTKVCRREDGSGSVSYRLTAKKELEDKGFELNIKSAIRAYRRFADMPVIHGSNTLVMLITRFEEFISSVLTRLYSQYPQKYLDDQKITFSEILDSGIDEVREKIIMREVDRIMRESFSEWFKIFESHGMRFDGYKEDLNNLKEIYYRRNVVVHNSGRVNATYLSAIPDSKAKLGTKLNVDPTYLDNAFATIKIIIFAILIEAVRLVKADKDDYLYSIFEVAFEELQSEHYHISRKVYDALANNKDSAAGTKIAAKVNYWLSKKALNGLDAIKTEVENFDFSALDESFRLAKEILLDHYNEATIILSNLMDTNRIDPVWIEEWPLFKEYKKTPQFRDFKVQHPDAFKILSVEIGQDALDENKSSDQNSRSESEAALQPEDNQK